MTGSDSKPRRARRIATDEAHAWARNLTLGNPYAKALLMALGYYVNDDGTCFVSIGTLAQDTDLSDDTVRRRLRWLEQIGALARAARWRDENGRVNEDGRGKRTSDLIRLMLEADCDEIEARAQGMGDEKDGGPSPDRSPSQEQGLNSASESVSPAPALGQPSHCSQGLTSEPEREDSPQSPPLASVPFERATEQASEDQTALAASLQEFRAIYPAPANDPELVAELWRGLSPTERSQALHGARGTRAYREKHLKAALVGPLKFLRSSALWAEFSRFAAPEKAPPPPRVFVLENSDEWKARAVIAAIVGEAMPDANPRPSSGSIGADFLGHLPPSGLMLAQFANGDGRVDTREWVLLDRDQRKQQIAAWRDRLFECTGRQIEPGPIDLGGTKQVEGLGGKLYTLPNRMIGLRVPAQWPPPKNGAPVPVDALPSALMTEADKREFTKEYSDPG